MTTIYLHLMKGKSYRINREWDPLPEVLGWNTYVLTRGGMITDRDEAHYYEQRLQWVPVHDPSLVE